MGAECVMCVTVPVEAEAVWCLQSAVQRLTRDQRGPGGHMTD